MRPNAIVTFERLMLLSILLSTMQLILQSGIGIGNLGPTFELGLGGGVLLLSVVLVLLVSRRRSNAARWVLAGLTVLGLAGVGIAVGGLLRAGGGFGVTTWLDLAAVATQTAAVAMLFTQQAREWFSGRAVVDTV